MSLELSEEQQGVLFRLVAISVRTGSAAADENEPLSVDERAQLKHARIVMADGRWERLSAQELHLIDRLIGTVIIGGDNLREIQVVRSARPLLEAEAQRLEAGAR